MANLTQPQLKTIRVYGTLAKLLKRRTFQAVVRSPQEAIRFLNCNFPQLQSYLSTRHFQIRTGDLTITEDEISNPIGSEDVIHITPAICGAGNNAVTNIIAGAALIVVSLLVPVTAPILLPLGIGLTVTGVAQLLAPVRPEVGESNDPQARDSYIFNGVQNTSREGIPVPCVYGEIVTGSVTISFGTLKDEGEIEAEFIAGSGDPDPEEGSSTLIFPPCSNNDDCLPGSCCDPSTGKCITGDSCGYLCGETTWYRPEFYTVWKSCGDAAGTDRVCSVLPPTTTYREERYYTVPCGVLPIRMEVINEPRIELAGPEGCDFASTGCKVHWYDANDCFLREYIFPGTVGGAICFISGTAGEIPVQVSVNECFYGGCSQC